MRPHKLALGEHYKAIGATVVAAAALDDQVAQLIRFLITPEPLVGRIITSRLGFRARLEMVRSLVAYRTENRDILDAVTSFAKRAEAAMRLRDSFAHSLWGVTVSAGKVSRSQHKPHVKFGITLAEKANSAAELEAAVDELEGCLADISQLRWKLLPYLHGVHLAKADEKGEMKLDPQMPILRDQDQ